jgi:hypothetical protein
MNTEIADKPITSVFPVKSQKCDFVAEPRCRLLATLAGKGLKRQQVNTQSVPAAARIPD